MKPYVLTLIRHNALHTVVLDSEDELTSAGVAEIIHRAMSLGYEVYIKHSDSTYDLCCTLLEEQNKQKNKE